MKATVALLLALRTRAREECTSGSRVVGTWPSCPRAGQTSPAIADIRPPRGGRGLAWLATNDTRRPVQTRPSGHLIAQVQAISTPNPWQVSKNSITKNCRATRDLQLCLNELGPIRAGFQIGKLQSMVHEIVNQLLDLEKFVSLKTTFRCYL